MGKKSDATRAKIAELESQLKKEEMEESAPAFNSIIQNLEEYSAHFSAEQVKQILGFFPKAKASAEKAEKTKSNLTPKFLLDGVYWSGRGFPPLRYAEWRKKNPKNPLPLNPKWVEENPESAKEYEKNPRTGADLKEAPKK